MNITSGESFDQILTDILHYFKPRVLVLQEIFGKKIIFKNTKVQFRVPELTVDNCHENMLESILSKVIPTHSLGILQKDCKINLL